MDQRPIASTIKASSISTPKQIFEMGCLSVTDPELVQVWKETAFGGHPERND
ncbi:hypothetical protein LOZ51_000664 [Ophidiomyces ophidiicola]|nr:hypothetical protein LOZ55_000256 [Ophidiomyces ophidiicola]KAI2003583.1 hypothetical protein LOZ51_000664 [Ophidiomyces ophidiicola]